MSMLGAVDLSTLVPSTGRDQRGAGVSAGSGGAGAATASHASTLSSAPVEAGQDPSGQGVAGQVIVEVDAVGFRPLVERSAQVPVLVLLSSASVEASTVLRADMETVARENGGRFQLAHVDVETSPEIAQAFQVQAIPSVVAVLAGQPVPLFQGAAPLEQIRQVVAQVLQVAESNGVSGHIVEDAEAPEAMPEPQETEAEREAREAIERGDLAGAEAVYDHALAQVPGDDGLRVAREQVRLMRRLEGRDPAALLAAADAHPEDVTVALAGADAALAQGDVDGALGRALEAVRTHSGDDKESARVRLLALFEVIGADAPEVARARRVLATLLF